MDQKTIAVYGVAILVAAGVGYFAGRQEPAATPVAAVEKAIPVPVPVQQTPAAPAAAPVEVKTPAPEPAPVKKPAPVAKPAPKPVVKEEAPKEAPPVEVAKVEPPKEEPPAPVIPAESAVARIQEPKSPQPTPRDVIASVRPPEVKAPPAPEGPHTVTLPRGMVFRVRLLESLASNKNKTGDTFLVNLDEPVVADGFVIAEKGAHAEGRLIEVREAGRVKGVSRLALELTQFTTSDGQTIRVQTESFEKLGPESVKQDATKVAIGTAIGAVIGAAAGGGKGAGVGAAAGGAAGAGDVLLTRGKPATIPSESRLSFRLDESVIVTERAHSE